MIQRIQSLFLLFVAVLLGVGLYFPVWSSLSPETNAAQILNFYGHTQVAVGGVGTFQAFPFAVTAILSVLSAILALVELFSFKNRLLQMKMGMGNTMLMLLNLGLNMYFVYSNSELWTIGENTMYRAGIFMLMAAVICNQISTRFIRRDEELVRSVDRIR